MHHELEARTRKGMEERIKQLESMLYAMQSDFGECARGKSECYFCVNDECCNCKDESECHFVWTRHF